ncbi:MAG TPA: IS4 family transposase [Gammaproteobacteria bacterium]
MAYHNTTLSQILKMVSRLEFERLGNQHDGRRRSDALSRWSQFVALSVGQLAGRTSLRDIEATLKCQSQHRYHLGSQEVSRSALGRANESLDYTFYTALFQKLYQRCAHHAPRHGFKFKNKLFSLDGTLISLSMKVFPWADYNCKKAAFKVHIGLDHDGLIPAFAAITQGRESETSQARLWNYPKGSVLVFDKGYNSYQWHNTLTDKGLIWVTRIRNNALYRVVERHSTDNSTSVTSDQTIEYTGKQAHSTQLRPVRRIGYKDPETGKHYVFITNNFRWSAQTIADIYKQRWQVELFFKWIKQNLKIKSFLGTSENAVMTQVMVALCNYLLLAFIKFRSKIAISLQKIIQLLQTNLFSRRSLIELLKPNNIDRPPDLQLQLSLVRD